MEETLRSDHGADILGIFITRNSSQFVATQFNSSWQLSMSYCTQQHFRWLRLNWVQHHKSRTQRGHQRPEGRSSHRKIISIGTRRGLKRVRAAGFLEMIVSWSHRKIRSNAMANKKPLAKSVKKIPESDVAHDTCARADVSISKMLSVICWTRCISEPGVCI